MNKMDIHQYEKRFKEADAWLQKMDISERNKEILLKFKNAIVLENLSKSRIIRYLEVFHALCRRLEKDLSTTKMMKHTKISSNFETGSSGPMNIPIMASELFNS
ncbi:MAG: hypothetical protein ABIA62_06695 [Candidatus Woesearchaeota archaeon]